MDQPKTRRDKKYKGGKEKHKKEATSFGKKRDGTPSCVKSEVSHTHYSTHTHNKDV